MSDPFRQFFLDTVDKTINQEPNEESLFDLLQIVSPTLTLDKMLHCKSHSVVTNESQH